MQIYFLLVAVYLEYTLQSLRSVCAVYTAPLLHFGLGRESCPLHHSKFGQIHFSIEATVTHYIGLLVLHQCKTDSFFVCFFIFWTHKGFMACLRSLKALNPVAETAGVLVTGGPPMLVSNAVLIFYLWFEQREIVH